jgi:uncharacterized protein YjbI with pentapeptide repeats
MEGFAVAKENHVILIKQGVDVWNAWREENFYTRPDLSNAYLGYTDLRGVNLRVADLSDADFSGTDLSGAKFGGAELSYADFSYAELNDADLRGADLSYADFSGADLMGANFRLASLIDSCLENADLTGAKLWETQRGGWSIKGIICKRVFWDREGKEATEYEDGDFEHIFAEKPRIVLRYTGGIGPIDFAMLPFIVERLQDQHPNCKLNICSLQNNGNGATVTITVEDIKNRDSGALSQEVEQLRTEVKFLQGQLHVYTDEFMPVFRELVISGRQTTIGQITGPTSIGNNSMSGDNYNNNGQAGAFGSNAHAHDMTFQQVQNQATLDLPRLAEELADLHTAMKRKTEGTREQDKAIVAVADAEEAASKGDGPTALRHLKAAGQWTLGVAQQIGVPVAIEAIKRAI